ncbi:unnamed protein product [Blepharisma stoltei]|uniref:Amidohydrolase-related domain-containing protein n=1 Tax=Blepharisma stoltei TaxID=1481888 RepID=A0AAU9J400_9CILI|nr:unnamed protein product [Blepharisma stoltei]
MGKKAFISRHIVAFTNSANRSHKPIFGIILVLDEIIFDVIPLDKEISVTTIIEKYYDWNPVNCEDLYISPGIIDLNVRREWEDYTHLTKAAASGGVTLLLEEVGYYVNQPSSGELYCDVGSIATLEATNAERLSTLPAQGVFGVKGYLFPPSSAIQSVPQDLNAFLSEIEESQLALFIDPTWPNPRMLYNASPNRLTSLEERFESKSIDSTKSFAAAFPDTIESDSSGEEQPEENPAKFKRQNNKAKTLKPVINQSISPDSLVEKDVEYVRYLPIPIIPEEEDDDIKPNANWFNRRNSRTIFDDLNKRIRESQANIENLSKAEQSTYEHSGSTSYSSPSISPSAHEGFCELLLKNEVPIQESDSNPSIAPTSKPANVYQARISKFRPPILSIKTEEKSSKERIYLYHLANFPDNWEISGVEKIIQSMKKSTCRIHITNLSSAAALNRVRQAKEEFKNLTCEISATSLCFTSASIKDGDTRFKNAPPIRTQTNLMLLWDLLKMKGIDSIASSHASIKPELKALDSGNFQKALNGICSLGFALQAVWTMLNAPANSMSQLEHYIVRLAKWFSLHPAKILNISDSRGSIEKGKIADLLIWDPYSRATISDVHSQYPEVSPFIGMDFMGKIQSVYVRGKCAFHDGVFKAKGKKVMKSI